MSERAATMKMEHGPQGPILRAQIPGNINEEDFSRISKAAFGLIHNLTGCNCMSGRISFVVEDNFAEVTKVTLAPVQVRGV